MPPRNIAGCMYWITTGWLPDRDVCAGKMNASGSPPACPSPLTSFCTCRGSGCASWLPLTGKVAKALVVDLDNTLWGGVIGEDGMTGIKCDAEYPGAAYQALQRAMLDLSKRGILLAICSKNNPDDAMEALNSHPGMLFAAKTLCRHAH